MTDPSVASGKRKLKKDSTTTMALLIPFVIWSAAAIGLYGGAVYETHEIKDMVRPARECACIMRVICNMRVLPGMLCANCCL